MRTWRAFLSLLRFGAFTALMFLHPVVDALGVVANVCLGGFVFCLLVVPEQRTALWAFLGVGLILTAFAWSYDALTARLAPKGFLFIAGR
ncbi:hypothetical protein QZM19_29795 [Burkholderia multivorans]|nr:MULTISPECIES: hypothetical protein [Burkholderia cepacia complex]MBR8373955.1 hypothetical protein [Burkholderia cenocepacia]MBR8442939.1 hypothetical protein [Burkholderia cenocepacia]MDN7867577.1 hypothetical protein [Burkholderia multivorans]MDR8920766.1 hypothetical protein [Burkholderia multivorans]MDR8926848.1 hypothetical protein [Burkholderia multivorans]